MAVWLPVQCPHCHSEEVIKNGKSAEGKQRYRCQNENCPYRTFILNQTYPGRSRQVKQQIVEMTLNGSGVRDIARVLRVSPTTVIQELKKTQTSPTSQSKLLQQVKSEQIEVDIVRVEEPEEFGVEASELDEMWSAC
jgi:transposase-like protein